MNKPTLSSKQRDYSFITARGTKDPLALSSKLGCSRKTSSDAVRAKRSNPAPASTECQLEYCDCGYMKCSTHDCHAGHCTDTTTQGDDSKPFIHGEEGTHSACKEMVEKFGANVGCCTCNGHKCVDTTLDSSKSGDDGTKPTKLVETSSKLGDDSMKEQIEEIIQNTHDCAEWGCWSKHEDSIDKLLALFQSQHSKIVASAYDKGREDERKEWEKINE